MRIVLRIDQLSFDANTIGGARCTLPSKIRAISIGFLS
jgi:hypothetical protein